MNHVSEMKVDFSEKRGPLSERHLHLIFPKQAIAEAKGGVMSNFEPLNNQLTLHAESRSLRDYAYLVIKCLAAKQTFIDEKILHNINSDPRTYISDFTKFTQAIIDFLTHTAVVQHCQTKIASVITEKNHLIVRKKY